MKKNSLGTFCLLFITLLTLLSFPREFSNRLRGMTVAFLAPSWQLIDSLKTLIGSTFGSFAKSDAFLNEKMQRLMIENQQLSSEISRIRDIFQQEMSLIARLAASQECQQEITSLIMRQRNEIQALFKMQLKAIPAQVVLRALPSWNSFCWINVGEADNERLATPIICKNSPVIADNSAIGVIDYVGWKQSRVQLITDPSLSPSIRALRGGIQNQYVFETISKTIEILKSYPHIFENPEVSERAIQSLLDTREQIMPQFASKYLAKGELQGSSSPCWRNCGPLLKGTGFNYDFTDEYGPAQDLRNTDSPILKINDILVTTGMDGVFPPGLTVAEVSYVAPLKEEDYYYELEAKPLANLGKLSTVFVLPPLESVQNL